MSMLCANSIKNSMENNQDACSIKVDTPLNQQDVSSSIISPDNNSQVMNNNNETIIATNSPSSVLIDESDIKVNNDVEDCNNSTIALLNPQQQPSSHNQTISRNNETSHHSRRLYRHYNRRFSKNNVHRMTSSNSSSRDSSSNSNASAITMNRQHVNPMMISLLACMSLYMIITFASDVAMFYKPSWSTSNEDNGIEIVSFGVDHGREIPFSPHAVSSMSEDAQLQQSKLSKDSNTNKKETNNSNSNDNPTYSRNLISSLRGNNKNKRRPVLSNIRRSTSSIHSVPIFYPSKINMLLEQDEEHHNYFPNDSWNANHFIIFSFYESFHHILPASSSITDLKNSNTFFGIVIGFMSCVLFITYGPNVIRKRLLGFQSRRLQAQVYRSR